MISSVEFIKENKNQNNGLDQITYKNFEKKYSVFLSSTFIDMEKERRTVIDKLIFDGFFPIAMEFFPAASKTPWEYIKDSIDKSDIYVIVLKGRYGCLDDDGMGFTEKEYDYAKSIKKPVLAFYYENKENLKANEIDDNDNSRSLFNKFEYKVKHDNLCSGWKNADNLASVISSSLNKEIKNTQAIGWVRATNLPINAFVKNEPNANVDIDIDEMLELHYRDDKDSWLEEFLVEDLENRKLPDRLEKISIRDLVRIVGKVFVNSCSYYTFKDLAKKDIHILLNDSTIEFLFNFFIHYDLICIKEGNNEYTGPDNFYAYNEKGLALYRSCL